MFVKFHETFVIVIIVVEAKISWNCTTLQYNISWLQNSQFTESSTMSQWNISLFPYRKIYSFVKMSEVLLMAWICGDEARYMETLKMEEVSDTCTHILRQFLNDQTVPKPKHCIL